MEELETDFVIIGGGIVGLTLAHQLKEKFANSTILIIDKEKKLGLHSSGRNSGILHAGIYYKPNSLRADVCVKGRKRLLNWCEINNVNILKCGKVIAPQDISLDSQLDLLFERGTKNGAEISFINEKEFLRLVPFGRTASGRALWSPHTSVVDPKEVVRKLEIDLRNKGVKFLLDEKIDLIKKNKNSIICSRKINYGFFFNCAGLFADEIAKKFGINSNVALLPFKGSYWKLSKRSPFTFKTNLYPVPDLSQPFLGIHVTPSLDGNVYLGPSAIPALGRENYLGFEKTEIMRSIVFLNILAKQFFLNKGGFRKYSQEQALHGLKLVFANSARKLIPGLKLEHLERSNKVGIRPQLFDKNKLKLVDDFKIEKTKNSLHVLNAISPAFTASFELADLLISNSNL